MNHFFLSASALLLGTSALFAQGSAFQTPGMPSQVYGPPEEGTSQDNSGQASRFSSVFNPAFSFVGDIAGDYRSGAEEVGWDIQLRVLELGAQAWVDPTAWAYFIAVSDGESLNIEEAALHYKGLGDTHTLRVGKFFLDFGKQMQTHIHELRTLERPLVLREYLGDEVAGTGVQWDHWFSANDTTAVRFSLGAFSSLLPEHGEEEGHEAEAEVAGRKSIGNLNYSARVTGFTDLGTNGTLQLGTSARFVPDFAFVDEEGGGEAGGLDNTVWGLDVTYGWKDETATKSFTAGLEFLVNSGDVGAELGAASGDAPLVADGTRTGWLLFADHALDPNNSIGLQISMAELADADKTEAQEIEAYYTRYLSEFHRLRFSISTLDVDGADESFRAAVQYTFFVGAHGHGVNW
jgi:hypothetical protein